MGKIGLFGGSFNPVHLGHLAMVQAFLKAVDPDFTLVMPCAIPPHKAQSVCVSDETRLALVQAAFGALPKVEVDAYEMQKGGKSYTFETLRHLRTRFPKDEIVMLVGGDSFLTVQNWVNGAEILKNCTLCGLPRGTGDLTPMQAQADFLQKTFGAKTQILPHSVAPYSSTQVRQVLPQGANPYLFVPAPAAQMMIDQGLYGVCGAEPFVIPPCFEKATTPKAAERLAGQFLGSYRLHHTACVAKTAADLCLRHFSPDLMPAAELAGWLHDLCKELPPQNLLQIAAGYDMITVGSQGEVLDWKHFPQKAPALWHSLVGAALASELGAPKEVAEAVGLHTQGGPHMPPLAQLLFVADCASADRSYADAPQLRQLADQDLNAATGFIFDFVLKDLAQKGAYISDQTKAGAAYYGG